MLGSRLYTHGEWKSSTPTQTCDKLIKAKTSKEWKEIEEVQSYTFTYQLTREGVGEIRSYMFTYQLSYVLY